ncbi:hypothetical protein STVIR_0215 [Streptomyces viridochromogenes Tue57]|uniref:Uncharacterized protein n=1 Tax=Streptomyces viridochromogenes Tue57 TaxID=1160705 RepID=L8PTU8_STRVR|nr:hypothetical protein STVIR_0215 [Streptomyces viridochromogenes Tue57]
MDFGDDQRMRTVLRDAGAPAAVSGGLPAVQGRVRPVPAQEFLVCAALLDPTVPPITTIRSAVVAPSPVSAVCCTICSTVSTSRTTLAWSTPALTREW